MRTRRPLATIALLSTAALAPLHAQQYVISTIAGGPPPPTPVPGLTLSLGTVPGLAADAEGNVYFVQPGGYVPVVLQVGDRASNPAVWIAVAAN